MSGANVTNSERSEQHAVRYTFYSKGVNFCGKDTPRLFFDESEETGGDVLAEEHEFPAFGRMELEGI